MTTERIIKSKCNINPTISVIVPVYKVENYIHRCVDSILRQTFTDFELILVDDGSPDCCGGICEEYAKKDARIIVIHQSNQGLSAARNTGIDWVFANSGSKWFCFVDSDDWVHKQYLEFLYKAASDNKVELSSCEYLRVKEHVNDNKTHYSEVLMTPKEYYLHYQNGNEIVAWGKLYKRELFNNVRYPVGRIHEDGFVTPRLLFSVNRIAVVEEQLYYYFQNAKGITQSPFTIHNYDSILARENRIQLFKSIGDEYLLKEERTINRFEIALFSIAARKAKIYNQVHPQYKVGWFKAMWIIRTTLNENQYESIMIQYYPNWIKMRAVGKKLFKTLFDH